ncbi:hypothetical protein [Chryseobacterium sp. W4I1]|uniref:AbiTii domain-containing protein n=1 Tax=Chryseobacterium sp. W4I1 TaxID=3042293 RepID=UPI0027895D2A|nr:hypothetical protein [Chryseobacterium sp. W4I1]MDQ0783194.1 hypothetical protein [Chryseobacterium sp. W4I1]
MELISDIINSLIDDTKPINTTLLKTKVLASRIENNALLEWVNSELNGYPTDESLPIYRKNIVSHIKGDYIVGNMQYSNQPIPTMGMKEKFGLDIVQTTFRQGISTLEHLINTSNSQSLMYPFPAEIVGYLEANWKSIDTENGYFLNIINARKIIATGNINEIISQVRNRLLDFMLEIDKQYGNLTEIKDLSKNNQEITKIMKQTIINNSGDGAILNAGDNSNVKAKIIIQKNSKTDLSKVLTENGVDQNDIHDLFNFIDSDDHDVENKKFGSKTNEWIQKMLGKALNSSWEITIGAAGGLLADSIGKYLGY